MPLDRVSRTWYMGRIRDIEHDDALPVGRWKPATVFAAVVLVASVVPVPGDPSGGAWLVPTLGVGPTGPFHFVGYAVLVTMTSRSTGRHRRGLVRAATIAIGFGFGIELLQATIPWRTFAWNDVAVNAAGAVVGAALLWGTTDRRAVTAIVSTWHGAVGWIASVFGR